MTDFEKIKDFESLYRSFLKARRGKRGKYSVAKFEANLLECIHALARLLETKKYTLSDYFIFRVFEPKERVVMSLAFKDKVVQQSICEYVLKPRFSHALILDNYASQEGKGTDFGLDRLVKFMRTYYFRRKAAAEQARREAGLPMVPPETGGYAEGWVLKCDVRKYFYNIRHKPLKQIVRKYIKDPDVLWLIDLIIDSTEDPGIPIGNQTSQWFAVLYLSGMDHMIKEKLGCEFYGRYMDDFYIIHEDKAFLQKCRREIEAYIKPLGLELNQKTNIFPLRNGINFLGFRTFLTDTGKVVHKVRNEGKSKEKRRVKKHRALVDEGKMTLQQAEQSYQSYRSHALRGNGHHLVRDMDRNFRAVFKESEFLWRKHYRP